VVMDDRTPAAHPAPRLGRPDRCALVSQSR